jgi:predicted benzoate:H+ symporter BenE
MNEVMAASAAHRFSAELVAAFAVVALLLASVGIYGLLAYLVEDSAPASSPKSIEPPGVISYRPP